MEPGVSTLQAAFNLGAVPLKNEKPSDVIRAAFYDNNIRNALFSYVIDLLRCG